MQVTTVNITTKVPDGMCDTGTLAHDVHITPPLTDLTIIQRAVKRYVDSMQDARLVSINRITDGEVTPNWATNLMDHKGEWVAQP